MASTLAAMEDTDHHIAPVIDSLVQGKDGVATAGSSTTANTSTKPSSKLQVIMSKTSDAELISTLDTIAGQRPLERTNAEADFGQSLILKDRIKPTYRSTPHTKKGKAISPTKRLNQFSVLNSTDEEVESLILKAQQSRKTVHPRLLGAGGRELEPGGFREYDREPSPHS